MNTWDLTYLFENQEKWREAFNEVKKEILKLSSYQGKLANKEIFKEYFLKEEEIEKKFEKVYQYASLKSDQNRKNTENARYDSMVMMLYSTFVEVTSFSTPEVLALGKEKVFKIIDEYEELEKFRFLFERMFHSQEHILSADKEQLLSYYSNVLQSGSELYSALSTADGKIKDVKLSDGKHVKVSQGSWTSLIADATNPRDKKKIFEALYSDYESHKNTYAQIYNTVMQAEKASARARNYKSILEANLFDNNIPEKVYTNLIDVASKNTSSLKKYLQLRKKILGLKTYHTYDRFSSLAKSNKRYSYEEGKQIFFESIKSCPKDFIEKAHEVLKEGFVDVYEVDGKRSGAYSSGMKDLHPFILLNYHDTLDDVFTLAHESGHSIHSLYAMEAQPSTTQNYTIFIAEIASTFNEHMLLDYFMKSKDLTKEDKIVILQKAIDEIVATFFRQTLFAHYEYEVSKLVEKDEPINYEVLSNIMIKLYKKYYGLNITKEKVKQYVWAYIPHMFATPFYVYQYATSFAASFALYKNVVDKKENAFEKYTNLLKSGGSKYPVDQARDAGIDFLDKNTFMAVIERMNQLVDELEKLAG